MLRSIALAVVLVAAAASAAMADDHRGRGHRGNSGWSQPRRTVVSHRTTYYNRPAYQPRVVEYRSYYHRPPVYRSYHFGFGWSWPRYAPPVVVYSTPVVYREPAPVVVVASEPTAVIVSAPPPPVVIRIPAPPAQVLQFPAGFVETGREYHSHGSDAGTVDWVKGVMPDGRRVKLVFNDDGTVKKTKYE